MRQWQCLLLIAVASSSCVHYSWLNADRKALQNADTAIRLQPIARNSLEWWYFNGHLQDSSGNRYAFHTAMFRRYAFPFRYIWMSNTALTDLKEDTIIRHYHFYRDREVCNFNPLTPDIASQALSMRFSGNTWQVQAKEPAFSFQISGRTATPALPMAPDGIIQYGQKKRAGYLSMPWLEWKGNLRLGDSAIPVHGTGWFDRQWSVLHLTRKRYSWNWISLEHDSFRLMVFSTLDDRRDTQYLHIGQVDPYGHIRYFSAEAWMLHGSEPAEINGRSYPQIWQLWVPELELTVSMKALVKNATFRLRAMHRPFMTYWEGPAEAWGLYRGRPFQSRAFIEITQP